MNFLAHCLLARPGAGLVAGGVLGDFVKGPIPSHLPADLKAGIRLHRRIDSYSNRLPELRAGFAHFDPALRRVAPVLLDIVADHCLALAWRRFAEDELEAFTPEVYGALASYHAWAPEPGREFVNHMTRTDLLARYVEPLVIRRAMANVLARLRFTHLDHKLDDVLAQRLPALREDFLVYFPLLQQFARDEREAAIAAFAPT